MLDAVKKAERHHIDYTYLSLGKGAHELEGQHGETSEFERNHFVAAGELG